MTKDDFAANILRDAAAWLHDCFADAPANMDDAMITAGVQRHYAGGWSAFTDHWMEDNSITV